MRRGYSLPPKIHRTDSEPAYDKLYMDAYLTSIRWPGTVSIHTAYEVLSIDLRAYINLDKLSTSSDQKGDPAAEIAVNNGQLLIPGMA